MKRAAKPKRFRSIRTRMMVATTLLIVTIVAAILWLWAKNESDFYREQKQNQARSLAVAISQSLQIELAEQNWGNLQVRMDLLLQDNPDFVYAMVSDFKLKNQIVVAAPAELKEQYIPDLMPLAVTKVAIPAAEQITPQLPLRPPRITETFLLRDVEFPKGSPRARRGERIVDVAADIPNGTNISTTSGILRLGISLQKLDAAIANAILKALTVGAFSLVAGLVGSYILAQRLTEPVLKLRSSAAKIAAGDLQHRAEINLSDEIGALARSFNDMSASLQDSFSKLQRTLDSFERFVPDKFLQAIAPHGIENIQVGESSTRTIAILFADIRGYTAMSEGMTPLETFEFLNAYLACMGQAIDQCGGFIDKYIGDAIMALFDDAATDGVLRAAISMQQALIGFNTQQAQHGMPMIEIGIGIHQGEVVMGTVGFTSRIESTVIGDAVNLASRLEGLTKLYGCKILLTDTVVAGLIDPQAFSLRLVDAAVKVKGKETTIAIYELQLPDTKTPAL